MEGIYYLIAIKTIWETELPSGTYLNNGGYDDVTIIIGDADAKEILEDIDGAILSIKPVELYLKEI